MEDHSTTQSFSNLHQHRHRPSVALSLPAFESPEAGFSPSLPAPDSMELFGTNRDESETLFSTTSSSTGQRRARSGGDKVFLDTSGGSVDGDTGLGERLDRECGPGGYFDDLWCESGEKEAWDDGESSESTADHFHGDGSGYGNAGVFYRASCAGEEGLRHRAKAECDGYTQMVYNRETNSSCFPNKQTTSYYRGGAGTMSDGSLEHLWMNLRVFDRYLGKEEDYGSSCGSGEDQVQTAEVEGPFVTIAPSGQGTGRWRGEAESHTLTSASLPQTSHVGRTYTQKLDSFSEAFLSQRKRRIPFVPSRDSSEQVWEMGERGPPGPDKSKQSCAFGPDSYMPPSSSSSSSSPAHHFLPSFPSPPPSSHFMPSVLSPPPTPLPPPSHSPSKMDSSRCSAASQGGESHGPLQFFMPHLQSVPSVHPPGMIWKFPLLSHCFPQSAGDLRSSHGDDSGNIAVTHDILQSPEPSFFFSPPHCPSSLHPSRALCPSSSPSLHTSAHPPSRSPQLTTQHHQVAGYTVSQRVKKSPGSLNPSHQQKSASPLYTGRPFPSVLHSSRHQRSSRYTPQPQLSPHRRGAGLYCSLTSLHRKEEEEAQCEEDDQCSVSPHINVGPDFQADLPPCREDAEWSELRTLAAKSSCEQLLWKPIDDLEDKANVQDQVEKLLSICSSSCLPGGGSNTELALHCLHYCQGNTMATLEMLLFSEHSPAGDYHYSGDL